MKLRKLLALLTILLFSIPAFAHDPQLSGIGIAIRDGSATIAVQVHLKKLKAQRADEINDRLVLVIDGAPFKATDAKLDIDPTNGVAYWRATYHGTIETFTVHRLFPEDQSSRTIVSITKNGVDLQETILDAAHPSMDFGKNKDKPQTTWNVNAQFLSLGIMHIFTGTDHILFIFGLILVGGGLRPLLKTVTSFTAAHSITLTVAATGLWTPASKYVEPLIALSIIAIAIENLRNTKSTRDWRPFIAFVFGLIHGFGFAGGLTEAGLPHGALGCALASFNVGVECAQASIVLAVSPILATLARSKPTMSYRVIFAGSLTIALLGAFWFIDRIRIA